MGIIDVRPNEVELSWAALKVAFTAYRQLRQNPPVLFKEDLSGGTKYRVWLADGFNMAYAILDGADKTDFDNNYANLNNKPISGDGVIKTSPQSPQPGPGQDSANVTVLGAVPKNDILSVDYVVPSGKTFVMSIISGTLFEPQSPSADFYGSIVWDAAGSPEVIDYFRSFAFNQALDRRVNGDGVKILRLTIHNNTNTDTIAAATLIAFLEDT